MPTNCSTHDRARASGGTARGRSAPAGSASGRPPGSSGRAQPSSTRRRSRSGSAAGRRRSPGGWPEKVSSRSSCTSSSGGTRSWSRVVADQRHHQVVGPRPPDGVLLGVVEVPRRGDHADGPHQAEDLREPVLQHGHRCAIMRSGTAGRGRSARAPRAAAGLEGPGQRGLDELVLGVEDPEDRALGDAGRLGDLPGGHRAPVDPQQRQGRVGERLATLRRGERRGTGIIPTA